MALPITLRVGRLFDSEYLPPTVFSNVHHGVSTCQSRAVSYCMWTDRPCITALFLFVSEMEKAPLKIVHSQLSGKSQK